MSLFYYDNTMKSLEQNNEYKNILAYLENNFQNSDQVFATKLIYSWYLYCEGQFIDQQVSSDWQYYMNEWSNSLNYSMQHLKNLPITNFAIAYTLEMNGMDINDSLSYEDKIIKHYQVSKLYSTDRVFLNFLNFFINHNEKKLDDEEINMLFPNDSIIDKYFIEILS